MPTRDTRALPLMLLSAVVLSGCGSTNLNIDDNGKVVPVLRAVHRFEPPGGGGIEVEAQAMRGDGSQVLGSGQVVRVGEFSVQGPGVLNQRARAAHLQIAYNHLLFADRPVQLEWFAGIVFGQLDWRATSSNPADPELRFKRNWYGPAGGVMARFKLAEAVALEARYSAGLEARGLLEGGSRVGAELMLAWRPVPGLALRGGVTEQRSSVDSALAGSNLSLRTRGPYLGLNFEF